MDRENISLIEQTILNHKKKEIYNELRELAHFIRGKQQGIQLMARMFQPTGEKVVKDFLIHVITKNEIPADIVLPQETEQYLLTEGIEELLQNNKSI
ncbi:hypothetical protein [Bacillus albus]|uniref:hypothetical protein n=1 Tax=Bacillus albus TaxID=2026189 RepID=UPI00101FE9D5|nr:hypothetical protein [Bacillus albus]